MGEHTYFFTNPAAGRTSNWLNTIRFKTESRKLFYFNHRWKPSKTTLLAALWPRTLGYKCFQEPDGCLFGSIWGRTVAELELVDEGSLDSILYFRQSARRVNAMNFFRNQAFDLAFSCSRDEVCVAAVFFDLFF